MNNRIKSLKCGLCKDRHQIPCHDYIFPCVVENIFDFEGHKETTREFIRIHHLENGEMYLYVTGLTPCLVAVIQVCLEKNIKLHLLHYDRYGAVWIEQQFN